MLLRKVATISDKLKTFIQSGNYEIYILRLMNQSKTVFPGEYDRHKVQSHSECDFYDVKTLEKYEAKLPFDKKEGELICRNNSNLSCIPQILQRFASRQSKDLHPERMKIFQ